MNPGYYQNHCYPHHDAGDAAAHETLNNYISEGKLGEGTYGIVYRARHRITKKLYALKCIRFDTKDEGTPSTAIREVSILRQLRHPNIVELTEVAHGRDSLTLVFEYLDQDLHNYLVACGHKGLDMLTSCSFLYQLLQGLAFCHHYHIMHRDLKPQNLLLNLQGELKLADFGLARSCGIPIRAKTHEVVTLWYRPPDVMLGNTYYNTSIDIWGVGCIFAEMLTGRPLFSGNSVPEQLIRIFKLLGGPNHPQCPWDISRYPLWEELSKQIPDEAKAYPPRLRDYFIGLPEDGCDLLSLMLQVEPDKRITAEDALQHPFFRRLRHGQVTVQSLREAAMQEAAPPPPPVPNKHSKEAEEKRVVARRVKEHHLKQELYREIAKKLLLEPMPAGFLFGQFDMERSVRLQPARVNYRYYMSKVDHLKDKLGHLRLLTAQKLVSSGIAAHLPQQIPKPPYSTRAPSSAPSLPMSPFAPQVVASPMLGGRSLQHPHAFTNPSMHTAIHPHDRGVGAGAGAGGDMSDTDRDFRTRAEQSRNHPPPATAYLPQTQVLGSSGGGRSRGNGPGVPMKPKPREREREPMFLSSDQWQLQTAMSRILPPPIPAHLAANTPINTPIDTDISSSASNNIASAAAATATTPTVPSASTTPRADTTASGKHDSRLENPDISSRRTPDSSTQVMCEENASAFAAHSHSTRESQTPQNSLLQDSQSSQYGHKQVSTPPERAPTPSSAHPATHPGNVSKPSPPADSVPTAAPAVLRTDLSANTSSIMGPSTSASLGSSNVGMSYDPAMLTAMGMNANLNAVIASSGGIIPVVNPAYLAAYNNNNHAGNGQGGYTQVYPQPAESHEEEEYSPRTQQKIEQYEKIQRQQQQQQQLLAEYMRSHQQLDQYNSQGFHALDPLYRQRTEALERKNAAEAAAANAAAAHAGAAAAGGSTAQVTQHQQQQQQQISRSTIPAAQASMPAQAPTSAQVPMSAQAIASHPQILAQLYGSGHAHDGLYATQTPTVNSHTHTHANATTSGNASGSASGSGSGSVGAGGIPPHSHGKETAMHVPLPASVPGVSGSTAPAPSPASVPNAAGTVSQTTSQPMSLSGMGLSMGMLGHSNSRTSLLANSGILPSGMNDGDAERDSIFLNHLSPRQIQKQLQHLRIQQTGPPSSSNTPKHEANTHPFGIFPHAANPQAISAAGAGVDRVNSPSATAQPAARAGVSVAGSAQPQPPQRGDDDWQAHLANTAEAAPSSSGHDASSNPNAAGSQTMHGSGSSNAGAHGGAHAGRSRSHSQGSSQPYPPPHPQQYPPPQSHPHPPPHTFTGVPTYMAAIPSVEEAAAFLQESLRSSNAPSTYPGGNLTGMSTSVAASAGMGTGERSSLPLSRDAMTTPNPAQMQQLIALSQEHNAQQALMAAEYKKRQESGGMPAQPSREHMANITLAAPMMHAGKAHGGANVHGNTGSGNFGNEGGNSGGVIRIYGDSRAAAAFMSNLTAMNAQAMLQQQQHQQQQHQQQQHQQQQQQQQQRAYHPSVPQAGHADRANASLSMDVDCVSTHSLQLDRPSSVSGDRHPSATDRNTFNVGYGPGMVRNNTNYSASAPNPAMYAHGNHGISGSAAGSVGQPPYPTNAGGNAGGGVAVAPQAQHSYPHQQQQPQQQQQHPQHQQQQRQQQYRQQQPHPHSSHQSHRPHSHATAAALIPSASLDSSGYATIMNTSYSAHSTTLNANANARQAVSAQGQAAVPHSSQHPHAYPHAAGHVAPKSSPVQSSEQQQQQPYHQPHALQQQAQQPVPQQPQHHQQQHHHQQSQSRPSRQYTPQHQHPPHPGKAVTYIDITHPTPNYTGPIMYGTGSGLVYSGSTTIPMPVNSSNIAGLAKYAPHAPYNPLAHTHQQHHNGL